jgi:dihydroorotate dehydrogenase
MYRLIRPLLFKLDAETAHRLAIRAARLIQRLPAIRFSTTSPGLEQDVWDLHFANPVGIAAGLDKNAECVPFWWRIGCGFAEVGSVSADPAPGNPRPRAFRLPEDRALINRMGLNNDGVEAVVRRLPRRPRRLGPLGINIVKTHREDLLGQEAMDDFCRCYRAVVAHADYVTVNVSCPNTSDGKTFEEPSALDRLLSALLSTGAKSQPLLVKLSPPAPSGVDSALYSEIVDVLESHGVDGVVVANTAPDRAHLSSEPTVIEKIGRGGLSGPPIADRSTELIRFVYRRTSGRLPIIGVGGIESAAEAERKIRAGASLVQLYTGLVYEGPALIGRIIRGLARHVEREKKSIGELVGVDA